MTAVNVVPKRRAGKPPVGSHHHVDPCARRVAADYTFFVLFPLSSQSHSSAQIRAEGWTPSANLKRERIDGRASIFRGLHHGSVLGATEPGKGFGNLGEGHDGREPSRFRNTCEAFKSVSSAVAPLAATVGIRPCELGLWASRS